MYSINRTMNYDLMTELNRKIFGKGLDLIFKNHKCWIVWKDKEPVGLCSYKDFGDGIAFLSRAGMIREHRGHGLQQRMIRIRLRACKEAGFKTAITYTTNDNGPSFHSLQKAGFFLYCPQDPWAGTDKLYWRKSLQSK